MKSIMHPIIILLLFVALWGCSGDNSGSNVTSSSKGKTTAKSLINDKQITNDLYDQGQPATAYDNVNNQFIVVWTHTNQDGTTDIKGQIYQGSGGSQTVPPSQSALISVGSVFDICTVSGNQAQPKVAFSGSKNRYLVVWTDSRNTGYSQIYGRYLDKDGTALDGEFQISVHGTTAYSSNFVPMFKSQSDPDIIYNSSDANFYVSWVDVSDYDQLYPLSFSATDPCGSTQTFNYNLSGVVLDNNIVRYVSIASGGSTSPAINPLSIFNWSQLTAGAKTATTATYSIHYSESRPRLASSPVNGEIFIAWSGTTVNVTATFSFTKTTVTIDPGPPAITEDRCVKNPISFVATSNDSNTKVKVRRNQGLGTAIDYTFGGTTNNVNYPALSIDPNTNRFLVVWEENQQVVGQLIDGSSFSAYGSSINISSGVGARTSASVAFDNVNQRFLVVWEDARNQSANISNIDIYGQFVDPQGQLSGGNTIITVAPGNQLAPSLAFGGPLYRQFLVVWKDGRASANADIWAQLMEFSVMPQLTITDESGNPILNGSFSFGTVTVGQPSLVNLKLRNDGNASLDIYNHNALPLPYSFITQFPQQVTIAPGTAFDVTISFTPTANGSYAGTNFLLDINSNGGNSKLYLSGSGAGAAALQVTTDNRLAEGQPNIMYNTTLQAIGGSYPYTWSISGNPEWLSIDSSTGTISGIPKASGSYTFTVNLTDNNFPSKNTASKQFTLVIGAISITSQSLANASTGVIYSQTLTQNGATTPLNWSLANGTVLPDGLILDPVGGIISGMPTTRGTFNFTIKLSGANGSTSRDFSIVVDTPLAIDATSLSNGVLAKSYLQTLTAQGGRVPYSWSIVSPSGGALPDGLNLAPNSGAISGTPSAAGQFYFIAKVTDADNKSATKTFSIVVTDPSVSGSGSILFTDGTNQITGVSFGNVYKTSSSKKSIIIKNSSSKAITISGVTSSSTSFVVSGAPFTVPANNGTYTLDVNFNPSQVQSYSGTIELTESGGVKYQILATGTGIAANVELYSAPGIVTYFNTLSLASLPTQYKPTNFIVQSAVNFQITGVTPGTVATVAVTVANMPTNPKFYKIVGNQWWEVTDARYSGNIVVFDVLDDGIYDSDRVNAGVISDPFVIGTTDSGSGVTPPATSGGGGGGGGCFIATAAYGSYLDPHVNVLRNFRDQVLLKSTVGAMFVKLYYSGSPVVADFIREHESLRVATRLALTPLVYGIEYPALTALLFGLILLTFAGYKTWQERRRQS